MTSLLFDFLEIFSTPHFLLKRFFWLPLSECPNPWEVFIIDYERQVSWLSGTSQSSISLHLGGCFGTLLTNARKCSKRVAFIWQESGWPTQHRQHSVMSAMQMLTSRRVLWVRHTSFNNNLQLSHTDLQLIALSQLLAAVHLLRVF